MTCSQDEIFLLVRDIRRLQIEYEHAQQAVRIRRRAQNKEKKRREEGEAAAFLRPVFICDECGVVYAQSESRVFHFDDTMPDLLLCTICNKLLKSPGATPKALLKWYPERFNKEK